MPLASSNNLILAGIQDIVHALQHPSPNLPLAPLSNSHFEALIQLTAIHTFLAPPLRILPSPAASSDASPPPTASSDTTPVPSTLDADAPLRVGQTAPAAMLPPTIAATDTPLRVVVPHPPPAPNPATPKGVTFAPLPTATIRATFDKSTGSRGTRCNRRKRRTNPSKPLHKAKTVHHNKKLVPAVPRAPPRHPYGTRSQKPPL